MEVSESLYYLAFDTPGEGYHDAGFREDGFWI